MGSVFAAMICFGVFLISMIYFIRKRNGYVFSFLTGAGVFFLFQLVIRIPLIQLAGNTSWFIVMTTTMPLLTGLFYAGTAGLFEEIGRYLGFRICRPGKVSWLHGVAFGLGHGGIEAVWVGWQLFANAGLVPEWNMAIAGMERMCTLIIHIGFTLLVLRAVEKRRVRYLLLAILLHTLLDLPAVLVQNVWIAEGLVILCAAASLIFIIRDKKRRREEL